MGKVDLGINPSKSGRREERYQVLQVRVIAEVELGCNTWTLLPTILYNIYASRALPSFYLVVVCKYTCIIYLIVTPSEEKYEVMPEKLRAFSRHGFFSLAVHFWLMPC